MLIDNLLSTRELEDNLEFDLYGKRDLQIVKGSGALVYDENGREYLDCVGGIAVTNIGHSNPSLVHAITEQAKQLITCPEIFYNDTRAKFLHRLNSITPHELDRIFLCNSGTEAIEAALKFTKYTIRNRRGVEQPHFIALMRSFHGRSHGSLSLTFDKKYRESFTPLPGEVSFVPMNRPEKLQANIRQETVAIIVEIIQGEGGVNIIDEDYLQLIRQICDHNDILLIIDEIQTGFGRTGSMFAFEQFGVVPDILCLAKGIAGGFPMGAVIARSDRVQIARSLHGSTFGGNPLASAAGIASIDYILANNLPERVYKLGKYFQEQLESLNLPIIRDIRGRGLMIGIELRERAIPYVEKLMESGLLVTTAGSTVLRIVPPLVITQDQIDRTVHILNLVLQKKE